MFLAMIFLLAQVETRYEQPTWFAAVIVVMLVAGLVAWLIAAVLGFARARAFGPSTRWFSFAAVCMIIYHVQFLFLALASLTSSDMVLPIGSFFNLFVVLAAICSIMGFISLTNPR